MTHPSPGATNRLQLAMQNHQGGRLDVAASLYRQILTEAPNHPAALALLGTLEAQRGHTAAALPLLEAAAKVDPRNPDTQLNLGVLLANVGQVDRALTHLKRAASLRPNHADSHFALANALAQGRLLEGAEKSYRAALRVSPSHINARNNLGNVLIERGRPDEALVQFDEVLKRAPRHVLALHGKARAHEARGEGDGAEAAYRQLIDCAPNHGNSWNSLGLLLEKLGRTSDAVDAFRKASEMPSDNRAEILSNLGCALANLDCQEEAAAIWRESIALRPDPRAVSKLYDHARQACLWDEVERLEPLYRSLADAGAPRIHPYPLLMAFSTKGEQLNAAKASARAYEQAGVTTAPKGKRKPQLTIGYLSPDFRQHAVAQLMAEMPELHHREKFRVVGLSTGPDDGSAMRARIASACDLFLDLAQDSDAQAAERIRKAEVDILVDLAGHTKGGRLGILARRPAPINATWLGYPGSTGGAFIDYLIADPVLIAQGDEEFYSEAVARLPYTYQPNDRTRPRPATASPRSGLGLPDDEVVFASFTQNNRLNRPVFALWMRILSAVPGSVLWLLGGAAVGDRLRRAAEGYGIGGERLLFAANLPLEQHLARYRAADIVLDPFPYNAHTTTSDALWMGCPVVTLKGETFPSRVAASLLQAAGLPELITNGEEGYLELAVGLAGDPAERARIREHLWQPPENLPIFNAPDFARHLEHAYSAMWERHVSRQKPTHIDIDGAA